uniref:Rhomboid protein Dioop_RBL9 n=1 Tax=Dioscorea oppositifolia TaxID=569628 RepID=A0A0A7E804_9LILI|nr:rhomboid protein Dioop_RBL9 [Dioscorea oppositifolia]
MAVVSSCSVLTCKDQFHPIKGVIQIKRGLPNASLPFQKRKQKFDVFSMIHIQSSLKFVKHIGVPLLKVYNTNIHKDSSPGAHKRAKPCGKTINKERQLKALDTYFSKLHNERDVQQKSWSSVEKIETFLEGEENQVTSSLLLKVNKTENVDTTNRNKLKTELGLLDHYFGKLSTGTGTGERSSNCDEEFLGKKSTETPNPVNIELNRKEIMTTEQRYKHLENVQDQNRQMLSDSDTIQDYAFTYNEASDFHFVSILASINIAVFLFEIASPIKNSDVEQLSLPLMYGAKINKLILDGEWWRLLTPMFLHSGFLHVCLGCWVLLTFGPQVCRGYGPFTFILLYLLGGICGNLTSFIHTPELTVCGTGPVFAIIGAWLVYQYQNKGVISREVSESMFWKAVIATALSFLLSNFGRIDDWTHLGATLSGIVFGFLTCPTLHLNNAPLKNDQKEGFALIQQQAGPCKSLAIFSAIILVLSFLAFFLETQLAELELDVIL